MSFPFFEFNVICYYLSVTLTYFQTCIELSYLVAVGRYLLILIIMYGEYLIFFSKEKEELGKYLVKLHLI